MNIYDHHGSIVCLQFALELRSKIYPQLYQHIFLEKKLGKIIKKKSDDHLQYGYDLYSHNLLYNSISSKRINAKLYSEESGLVNIGTGDEYIIISDPFDQSFLTAHTFRDASAAVCVVDNNYQFVESVIVDLNTHIIYFGNKEGVYILFDGVDKAPLQYKNIKCSNVTCLSEALIVCPGEKKSRRKFLRESLVTERANRLLTLSGILNLGRLAAGYIDAYVEPSFGLPIYEIVYAELAKRAGAIVTDNNGTKFELEKLISSLLLNEGDRYKIVACCTAKLHCEIMELLNNG